MLRVSRYTWDPERSNSELRPLFADAPPHEDLSLRSVGKTLARRKWLILLILCLTVGLAALAAKLLPKAYMAESQILFTQESVSSTGAAEDPDAPPHTETIGTQVSMLVTQSMAERGAKAIQKAADKAHITLKDKDVDPDELRTRIRVDNPERTDLITLSVEADTPEKAALMANHYAKAFVSWKKGIAEERARTFANSLSARLEKAQEDLRIAQSRLLSYQQQNEVQDISEQTKSLIGDYSKRLSDQGDLDRDTTAANEQLGQLESIAQAQSKGLKISHWIRDDNLILGLQKDLSDAEVERAHNALKYREGYPGVFEPIDARITDLKGRIRDVVDHSVGADVPSLSSQADAVSQYRHALVDTTYLKAKQNANKRVLSHIKTYLDKVPELQRSFANLTRDAEAAANRVSLLQTKYASVKAGIASAQSNVSFVGVATPPKKVARPRLGVNIALGLIAGLFLSTLAVLFAEGRRPTINDSDQLRNASRLPIIPNASGGRPWQGRGETSEAMLDLCAFASGLLAEQERGGVVLAHELGDSNGESPALEMAQAFTHLGRSVLLMRFASPQQLLFNPPSSEGEVLAGARPGEPRVVEMPCLSDARGFRWNSAELADLVNRCRGIYDVIVLSVCSTQTGPDYLVARPLSDLHLLFVRMGGALVADLQMVQDKLLAIRGGTPYLVARERSRHRAARRMRAASLPDDAGPILDPTPEEESNETRND